MHSDRLLQAIRYASEAHAGQVRKDTSIPYLSHLVAVTGLVLEAGAREPGGDDLETLAIAAMLHDVVEDCGGPAQLDKVRAAFGDRVAAIVEACTDAMPAPGTGKGPWAERKRAYLARLEAKDDYGAFTVSAADKLHNARTILADLRATRRRGQDQMAFWKRFMASEDAASVPRARSRVNELLWYYESLARILAGKSEAETIHAGLEYLAAELRHAVDGITAIAAADGLEPVAPAAEARP